MAVSRDLVVDWCQRLLAPETDFPQFEQCLEAIPALESLGDVPAGTRVLVRGDTDATVENGRVTEDVRLRSMLDTLRFGSERGWVQIVYGHIGRDPKLSLAPVAEHLQTLLEEAGVKREVTFIDDWMSDEHGEVLDAAAERVAALDDGAIVVLENTRKYGLERVLWKAKPADLAGYAEPLTNYANGLREKFGAVHVNEGFSASNRDLSSTLVPLAMDRMALGTYIDGELRKHVTRARLAELVVFSGIKIEKLDDLEEIIGRGRVKTVIAAGSLAMALKKADDPGFSLGLAADPANKKIHVPHERVEQARRMLKVGRERGVDFVLPVDFVLGDESIVESIPKDQAQFDVGPKTIELQAGKVEEFIAAARNRRGELAVAFHNGVFGKFEEDRFSTGTRRFMEQLKRMHEAGVEVYVGGGEGGAALAKYGDESWVTHSFTAGGTILKALGQRPIPYLKALYLKAQG
ncbi:MAG: phosphoglycerate kinase [Planctomycetes bacterium]|nr:phosphoglycerate kinase [Planctomycetota bacterium]